MSILEFLKSYQQEIASTVSVIAIVLAYSGLSTWRKQLKGSTRYQLAREILESIYKVDRAFSHVRNPFMSSSEYPDDIKVKSRIDQEEELKAVIYAYNERIKILNEEMQTLENSFIKGIAIYGDKYKDAINPLRQCRANLIVGIDGLIRSKRTGERYYKTKNVDFDKIIYEVGGESEFDLLSEEIRIAKTLIILAIKPYLTDRIIDRINRIGLNKKVEQFKISIPMIDLKKE